MRYLTYVWLVAASIGLFACGGKEQEGEQAETTKEQTEATATEGTPLEKSQIFDDVDVLRWAVDRVYRKRVLEDREPFLVKDAVNKKQYRVEMVNMPKEEFYPVGTETAYLGVYMKSMQGDTPDTMIVDFKLGWNPDKFDPKYKRKGTFEVLDMRLREKDGQARYRWVADGDYWKAEILTEEPQL